MCLTGEATGLGFHGSPGSTAAALAVYQDHQASAVALPHQQQLDRPWGSFTGKHVDGDVSNDGAAQPGLVADEQKPLRGCVRNLSKWGVQHAPKHVTEPVCVSSCEAECNPAAVQGAI